MCASPVKGHVGKKCFPRCGHQGRRAGERRDAGYNILAECGSLLVRGSQGEKEQVEKRRARMLAVLIGCHISGRPIGAVQ